MGNYAHFEGVQISTVYDLYTRHAEVARDIHQDTLRKFTNNPDLTVDLVREDAVSPDGEVLDKMEKYDSISVSSEAGMGTIVYSKGVSSAQGVAMYKERFAEGDMPIYTVAAGNSGTLPESTMPRVADFARSSLVVGEANLSGDQPFIEEHSSKLNPTLASDSPFNRGEKYQYYDVRPSLEGREDSVREWVIDNEVQRGVDLFLEHNKDKNLDQSVLDEGVQGIREALNDKYRVNEGDIARIDGMVQAYIENPENLYSLEVHEKLIREWVIDNEVQRGVDLFLEQNKDKGLDYIVLDEGARDTYLALHDKYRENEGGIAQIDGIVQAYIDKPETLHSQIMAEFREHYDIDENGYVTGLDGTSFSAPEQAGYVSGAMYEQEQREEKGLPILTKEEISALAKMSTIDTPVRENNALMHVYNNRAEHAFTYAGGHGVFNPDMFRENLNTAYQKIERNPDINRDVVGVTLPAVRQRNGDFSFDMSALQDQGVVVERTRIDIDMTVNGTVPHHILLQDGGAEKYARKMQMASGEMSHFTAWVRNEIKFGEVIEKDSDQSLQILRGHDTTANSIEMTVYGYRPDSLMHQMMEHSQDIAPQFTPKPENAEPEAVPVVSDLDNGVSVSSENTVSAQSLKF